MSKGYGVPNLEDRRWMAADLTDVDADDAESKGLYWYDAQVKKMGSGSKKGESTSGIRWLRYKACMDSFQC